MVCIIKAVVHNDYYFITNSVIVVVVVVARKKANYTYKHTQKYIHAKKRNFSNKMIKCHNTLGSLTDAKTYYYSNHVMFHRLFSLSWSPLTSFLFRPSRVRSSTAVKFCLSEMCTYISQNTPEKNLFLHANTKSTRRTKYIHIHGMAQGIFGGWTEKNRS